jgi:hypothetical protein
MKPAENQNQDQNQKVKIKIKGKIKTSGGGTPARRAGQTSTVKDDCKTRGLNHAAAETLRAGPAATGGRTATPAGPFAL